MVKVGPVIPVLISRQGIQLRNVFIGFELELAINVIVVAYGKITTLNKAAQRPQASSNFVAMAVHLQILEVDGACGSEPEAAASTSGNWNQNREPRPRSLSRWICPP